MRRAVCTAAAIVASVGVVLLSATECRAQSITAGVVAGTVTDPSGAAVPNATVTLGSVETNTSQKVETNGEGNYRFAFVPSGVYSIAVAANGFQTQQRPGVAVSAGQPVAVNVQLAVAGTSQTVNVVEAPAALETENADVGTTFNSEMVRDLPNPGGDITYIAQTAPGVVMNTQAGYGNFVANGMPGTSNLFTINGQNYNDPFFGINNSGASNLLLGANDIAEANVINSAYSGAVRPVCRFAGHLYHEVGNQRVPRRRHLHVERTRAECEPVLQQ